MPPSFLERSPMPRRFLPLLLTASFAGALPGTLLATEPAIAECAALADPTARLACYDAVNPPPQPAAAAVADFGFTPREVRAKSTPPGSADAPRALQMTVSKLRRKPTGEFVARMDNQQVWEQTELNSGARLQPGSEVTIKRGALGSWLLVTPDGIGTRVRRIE